MTKAECAIVMAYTGISMLSGDDLAYFYKYLAQIMGRPVYTHELAMIWDDIQTNAKPDFLKLCKEATA